MATSSGWVSILDYRTGERIARILLQGAGDTVAIDEFDRFDPTDIEQVNSLYWNFSDDPLRLYSLDITSRDYFEPRLIPKLLACRVTGNCPNLKVRPLALLNRVQPGAEVLPVERGRARRRR